MHLSTSPVIGLVGASGGLGTSTLAAAVAGLAAGLRRTTLLVDLAPNAGGLDQLAGCAHEPGLRWPAREEGMLFLRARDLPVWRDVRLLSQRGPVRPAPDLGPAAREAVARIARDHEVTVLDLPRPDHPQAGAWFALCSTVLLVAGTTPPQVAAALVAHTLQPVADAVVVRPSQGCGLNPDDVSRLLGRPLLHQLPYDPAVPRAVLEQEWPGSVDGAVRETAGAVLAAATETARGAA